MNTYTVEITRLKNDDSSILSLEPNIGMFTEEFTSEKTEYEWKLPTYITQVTSDLLNYKLSDPNAKVTFTENLDMTNEEIEKVYEITVVADNGVDTTVYTLNVSYDDTQSDATLKELNIDKGRMTPEFNSNTFVYDIYEYVDEEQITIEAIPTLDTSKIVSGTGEIKLTEAETSHNIIVEAESGIRQMYTLKIHKTIARGSLENLYLTGYEDAGFIYSKEDFKLNPAFNSTTYNYEVEVPFEYDTLNLKAEKASENDRVVYKVGEEEIDSTSYKLPEGKTIVTIDVYGELGELDSTYTVGITRKEKVIRTYISGKILTENVNNIHESKVVIYNSADKSKVAETTTQKDGTFKIEMLARNQSQTSEPNEVLNKKYDVEVTKNGYLTYKVTNVTLTEGDNSSIGTYNLIAGDVDKSGVIELDDMVYINEYFGVVINDANLSTMGIYDLNGDKKVDSLDREIVKSNLDKKAVTVVWGSAGK